MDQPQQSTGLDGLGFLRKCGPVPMSFALMQATVAGPAGIETMYVLAIDSAMGAHVTYWSRESLETLRATLDEALTGLTIARDVPSKLVT